MRHGVLFYGVLVYVVFLGVFLYAVGFVGNLVVPKTIDSGAVGHVGTSVLVNLVLLSLFAIQHTIMARPAFKARWTRIIPQAAERSTFVLAASLLLALIMWQWRPLPDVVWSVGTPWSFALWAVFAIGWGVVLLATFLIDHAHLFGLRQAIAGYRGVEASPPQFHEHNLYRSVRHPIMLGFVIAFWATPVMSVGHLLFAAVTTVYTLVGIRLEERDLLAAHGDVYADYRRRVAMILPVPRGRDS